MGWSEREKKRMRERVSGPEDDGMGELEGGWPSGTLHAFCQ